MIVPVEKIDDSYIVRIPKSILNKIGKIETVEIQLKDNALIIRPIEHPRKNWDAAFAKMAKNRDDRLHDFDSLDNAEFEEIE